MSILRPKFAATMMAFVPFRDMGHTLDLILECFPEAPCWPILTRSIKHMLEGIPCLIFDRKKKQILMEFAPEREGELLEFYERAEAQDLDYFATSPETAPGFYALLERLKQERPAQLKWIAFQTAGPVLLADTIKQTDGSPVYHNETLRDVLTKGINLKTRWLENKIKEEVPGVEVIAGLPETTLINFTSAGGSGSRGEIIRIIDEGFADLTCLTWIHCCANIDWTLLTDSTVDVINFDAYQHTEIIALYSKEFKAFLERGGMLAWGIVPVSNEVLDEEAAESLLKKMEEGLNLLVSKGIDEELLVQSSWIMPACDAVLLSPENAERAFRMTREISEQLKRKYGFEA